MRTLKVHESAKLLEYLFKTLSDTKKTRIRQYLKFGAVLVNGTVSKRFDQCLLPGDEVRIISAHEKKAFLSPQFGIEVVYEDDSILVIVKPSGLLTIATEKVATQTAFYAANEYVRVKEDAEISKKPHPFIKPASGKRIFIIHRLDKEASGLIVFAKNAQVKQYLQEDWKNSKKKYYAIVEGAPEKESGTLSSFLRENKFLKVYSSKRKEDAKLSITHYRVLRASGEYSLLEVELGTGRKHQIRVHLSDLGHPIIGDERYGSKVNPIGRLALHAYFLALTHPISGKRMVFQTPLPDIFERILEGETQDREKP